MANISSRAEAAREAARSEGGQFGTQSRTAPVDLDDDVARRRAEDQAALDTEIAGTVGVPAHQLTPGSTVISPELDQFWMVERRTVIRAVPAADGKTLLVTSKSNSPSYTLLDPGTRLAVAPRELDADLRGTLDVFAGPRLARPGTPEHRELLAHAGAAVNEFDVRVGTAGKHGCHLPAVTLRVCSQRGHGTVHQLGTWVDPDTARRDIAAYRDALAELKVGRSTAPVSKAAASIEDVTHVDTQVGVQTETLVAVGPRGDADTSKDTDSVIAISTVGGAAVIDDPVAFKRALDLAEMSLDHLTMRPAR